MGKLMSILVAVWIVALVLVVPDPPNMSMQLFGLGVVFVAFRIIAEDPRSA